MANHQIYTDWLYLWSLLYLASIPESIIIILKDSLRRVPLVGPAMQLFRFVVCPYCLGALFELIE